MRWLPTARVFDDWITAMITKKLFTASSAELKEDRKEFEIFIGRKNKDWVAKGVFLELGPTPRPGQFSVEINSEVRIEAISEGYDPTIGIMHEGGDGSSKLIFDLMEPERPNVDRATLEFVKGRVFDPADFVIRSDGVCRLNPEMARMVAGLALF
jgi:CRISPR associated protein Cas1